MRTDPRVRLGSGAEFDRIRAFLRDLPAHPDVRTGPGDDAAVLSDGTVISTDLSIEEIHFRLDWIDAHEAGWRATSAALSDLAAMAATPVGVLVSLAVPGSGRAASMSRDFMEGVRASAAAVGAALLGGDLSRSPGPVVLDVTVVGRTPSPLLRSGARPGDTLWVTGHPGAASGAVAAWRAGGEPDPGERAAFARPRPRIHEARHLADRLGARAGIDLSDGLVGDAGHLAAASGVRVVIDEFRIPVPGDLSDPSAAAARRRQALHGGEDYELLVALPEPVSPEEVEKFHESFDLPLTRVGEVGPGTGVRVRPERDAEPGIPDAGGWDHFEPVDEGQGDE